MCIRDSKKFFFGIEKGHGSSDELQHVLEPELRETVDVVFTGHDHSFQHVKPVYGIHHIVSGGAGKMRKGSNRKDDRVAYGADEYHFMDLALTENELHYQAIDDEGKLVHAATLPRRGWKQRASGIYVAA